MREYNAILTDLKPAIVMSTAMSRDLNLNRQEHPERANLDFWVGLFHKARASPHLMGKTKGSNWRASLPWLLKPDNVDKILNGAYDNGTDKQGSPIKNKYLAYSERNHAQKTFKAKKLAFRLFLTHAKTNDLSHITPALAMDFLHQQSKSRSGHAANKDRKNLAAAWQWGERYLEGFPKAVNPFLAVGKFKEEHSTRYVPDETDFWKVVDIATDQDKALLLALFFLGARRGEVFRLKWEDVDFINNRVRLGTQKTRNGAMRYDWLPLPQELKTSLLDWKEKRPHKTPWVFTVLEETPSPHNHPGEPFKLRSQFMRKICEKAGVKPFGYHAIRHLHASILFNEGSELSTVQRQLRHTSPTTTVRYLWTLGYEADHGQKVLSVIEGRRPAPPAVLQFEKKDDPQSGHSEDRVHRLGTQN